MLRHRKISMLLIVLVVSLAAPPDAYPHLAGDLNEDYVVDWEDLRFFSWQWLDPICLINNCNADLDDIDGVNMGDLALLANNWKKMEPHPIISEFMAKNCGSLLDGNGEASDWIEIYNPTDKVISLDGWYLTNDEDDDIAAWQFPGGLGLKPGEFIIVFASQKTYEENPLNYPYVDPSGYWHTNFELEESGGYLALVAPDSDTIIHEYPQYSEQLADVSYGLAQYATTLVPTGSTASYHVPDSNDAPLGTGWTTTDFNDSSWDAGPTGFGFGSSVGSGVATNVEGDMLGINASLWVRIEFEVEDPHVFDTLALRMRYEDGFAAYLNGHRVTMRNSPDLLWWNSTALSNRPIEDALFFDEINLMAYLDFMQDGKNVLAIQGLNDYGSDGEFLILPELVAARHTYVPQYFTSPTPETFNVSGLYGIVEEVWFSHERGFYYNPFQLILSNGTNGTKIRYTLDGSQPTISNGYTYTSPLDVNETATVRAIAIKAGWLDSKVQTHTYIFIEDVLTQSPNGEPPGSGWPKDPVNGQILDYGMDPNVVNHPYYAGLVDDALLAIPAISLVTDLDYLFDPLIGIYVNAMQVWERPTSVELINPDGSEGFQIDAGLRIRGQFDRTDSNPKHAFRLSCGCEYGHRDLKFPLFGDEGTDKFESIDLRTAQAYSWSFYGDPRNTMLREVFSRDLQGQMGHPYTRSRYYHLYINGQYWGIYQTQEHCTASYAESYLSDDEDDDDYFEAYGYDEGDYDIVKSDWFNGRRMVATEGTIDAFYRLYNETMAGFDNYKRYYRVQGLNMDGTSNPGYERLLDVDNLIDFMIIEYYTGNRDGPGSRYYGGKPNNTWGIYNRNNPDGFKWLQHESEHSLGTGEFNMVTPFTTAGSQFQYFNPHWLHERLAIQNPDYRLHFADHVHCHFFNDGLLTYGRSRTHVETRAYQIDMAIIAESARWGDSKQEPPLTKDIDWLQEINRILYAPDARHLVYRVEAVLDQFTNVGWYPDVDAPVFYINGSYQHGGEISTDDELTMDNPSESGTIYYTLDGTDPRQHISGNPVGTPYSGPITLNKSTHVKARVLYGTTWSALSEAIFAIGPLVENLRITEIMYEPKYTYNPSDPNEEYIELKNIGPNTINLNLVRFTEGIDFTFPNMELEPNEFVVVVKDLSAFEAQYGTWFNIAGEYTGSLASDNDKERIKLVDAIGRRILDFEYSDRWYPITDGDGFSLTIIDPTNSDANSWNKKSSWRPSVYRNGSPGADDSGILPNPGAIVINEVMSHSNAGPDWIELHNTTDEAINIGGWFLSAEEDDDDDDDDISGYVTTLDYDVGPPDEPNCMKYRIADGTTIDSNGYIVFYKDTDFNNPGDPGCLVPFTLSANGDWVSLSSFLDLYGMLTGYRQVQEFGASQTNVSFGRYYKNSTDTFDFVAMDYNTPDSNNAPPKVRPVVINEIMYNPSTGNQNEEYIELHNTTAAPFTLYRIDKYTPWKFTDGIDYTFSSSPPVTIPPYGYLLMVKDKAAFTARYGSMPPSVQVLANYDGRLNNDSGGLELSMPGEIDCLGTRYYIRIERIDYSDGSHSENCPGGVDLWPIEADGLGKSLSRKDPNDYGNDIANWKAAAPSPGAANP